MAKIQAPKTNKERQDEEFSALLALFWSFVQSLSQEDGQWSSLEELIKARADFAIRHAIEGFGIDYDDALELIRTKDILTDEERAKRTIIVAAIDNLIDFSTVEEYHLADEVADVDGIEELSDEEIEGQELEDIMEMLFGLCKKYNYQYANVENLDIEYAMAVAAYLSSLKDETVLMYMTMGDERVRPWHLQYEGFTAPRSQFPPWLIPPIEHQCRCYLVEEDISKIGGVMASSGKWPTIPEWFNRTFKESVANGGRIFSDEHPYFQVEQRHIKRLQEISKRIKSQYFE